MPSNFQARYRAERAQPRASSNRFRTALFLPLAQFGRARKAITVRNVSGRRGRSELQDWLNRDARSRSLAGMPISFRRSAVAARPLYKKRTAKGAPRGSQIAMKPRLQAL